MTTPRDPTPSDPAFEAIRALPPVPPLPPAFSRRVLDAARSELAATKDARRARERVFARVLVPVALVVCAVSWSYHVAHVAERVYLSHGGD